MSRAVIGVDPANSTGLAVVRLGATGRAELLAWRRVVGATGPQAQDAIRDVLDDAGLAPHDPDLTAAIEAQYVGASARSALVVAERAGLWRGAVESVGVSRVESVRAQRWQSAMLSGLVSARAPRVARKRAAARMAFLRWSVQLTYDEADAALIAAWACERGEVR